MAQIASTATGNLSNTATVSTTAATPADVTDSNTANNSLDRDLDPGRPVAQWS